MRKHRLKESAIKTGNNSISATHLGTNLTISLISKHNLGYMAAAVTLIKGDSNLTRLDRPKPTLTQIPTYWAGSAIKRNKARKPKIKRVHT